MNSKDIKQNTKATLMDELKSIKGVLDADDDNVPLLFDDDEGFDDDKGFDDNQGIDEDDVPILEGDDDDIPVLDSKETTSNKASLEASLRQLAAMDLPANNTRKPVSLEDKIRANAAAPLINDKLLDDQQTTVRDNPFLNKKPTDHFSESRKQAEDALKSVIAHSRALSHPALSNPRSAPEDSRTAITAVKDNPNDGAIEFTDNQFLKASSAPLSTATSTSTPHKQTTAVIEKDGAEAILKLLDEEPELELDLDEGFGELVDIDVDALIADKPKPKQTPALTKPTASAKAALHAPTAKKPNASGADKAIDDVIEEYMVILEAALKKKLKTQVNQIVDEVSDEYMIILETALKKKLKD